MRVDLSRVKVDWRTAYEYAGQQWFADERPIDVMSVTAWKPQPFADYAHRLWGPMLDGWEPRIGPPIVVDNIQKPEVER